MITLDSYRGNVCRFVEPVAAVVTQKSPEHRLEKGEAVAIIGVNGTQDLFAIRSKPEMGVPSSLVPRTLLSVEGDSAMELQEHLARAARTVRT